MKGETWIIPGTSIIQNARIWFEKKARNYSRFRTKQLAELKTPYTKKMNHKKILLVDDNPEDRRLFLSILEKLDPGLRCLVATNGLEALTLLNAEENIPSIIFLDLYMPVMDGVAFLEHMPAESSFRSIPVVIFTSSDDLEDKKKCADLGARAFFTKTRDKELLKEKIQEILEIDFTEQRRVS